MHVKSATLWAIASLPYRLAGFIAVNDAFLPCLQRDRLLSISYNPAFSSITEFLLPSVNDS